MGACVRACVRACVCVRVCVGGGGVGGWLDACVLTHACVLVIKDI